MRKDYSRRSRKKTRLTKLEEKRSIRQAFFFGLLTIVLALALIFLGIPVLIKMVVFLGDIRSSDIKPITSDTLAPTAPVLQSLAEQTKEDKVKVSGFSEEGSIIKLVVNGATTKEFVVGKDGSFVFDGVKLKEGKNEIKAKAVDSAGNESPFSQKAVVIFDNQPPEIKISSPHDGDEFFDKDKEIKVEGKSDPDITVYINERLKVTNSEGSFSITLELKDGENTIKIRAVDKAANETTEEIKVTYTP